MLPGASGSMPIPRKMSGSAIRRIEPLIVAISIPRVVFESATHLYSSLPACTRVLQPLLDVNVKLARVRAPEMIRV